MFVREILIIGGLLSTEATLSSFYLFLELGLLNISFSSIYLVRTRPALYEKKPAYIFKTNIIIFRLHLNMTRLEAFSGFLAKNKNES